MENGESSVATGDAGVFDSQEIRLVPDRTAVETACQAAATALDAFINLAETAPSDDSSVVRASARFNTTLDGVRGEACETLADVQGKLCVFRRLEEILPSDDPRLKMFALDLARDMADFLEAPDIH